MISVHLGAILSSKILHDNKKKTIYHDNAVIKYYDIPIFYFLNYRILIRQLIEDLDFYLPSFSDTKNLGPSITIPYFFN